MRADVVKAVFTAVIVSFAISLSTAAQTPTAKYNQRGELIWLVDRLPDTTGCEPARTFIGALARVEPFYNENDPAGFEFVLVVAGGKSRKFQISNGDGSIDPDLSEMLRRNRRFKINARQCGSAGFWIVEEVWRL